MPQSCPEPDRELESQLDIVVLAAGQGTRMRSRLPKVVHEIGGRPMLEHVLEVAQSLGPARIHVVYGHGGDIVRERVHRRPVTWVHQAEQLGTGHAVAQALPGLGTGKVLILYGDVPLILTKTLRPLLAAVTPECLALLTATLEKPDGYGRIVRDDRGTVRAIVEHQDADAEVRAIKEINTGILAADAAALSRWVHALETNNAQGEYYLTDVIARAVGEGCDIATAEPTETSEIFGVNDRSQLAHLERCYQRRKVQELMAAGVTVRDPARLDIRGTVVAGQDVAIDVNVVLEGNVRLGSGVMIGPNSVVRDAEIGADTRILENCVIEQARVGPSCRIGPFSRLRPGAVLGESVHIGNFVEVKRSEIGDRSKVNHLTYVGDSEIGRDVNIGAGTITCNYDGANKHRTVIGDEAFIGSGVELVAPITVGRGATIGAGSTIGHDAPEDQLTVERSRQKSVPGWERPVKHASER